MCCLNEGDRFDEACKNISADKMSISGMRLMVMLYKPDDLFADGNRLLAVGLSKKVYGD